MTPLPERTRQPRGTIKADPNLIRVCGEEELGVTTLSWDCADTTLVEVHVNSPNGPLFSRGGPAGRGTTHKWVGHNTVFYLQDVSNGQPLTPLSTLASVTVKLEQQQCP